jgi:hypothetical protein
VFCSISAKFSHCNNCEKHETRRHQFSNWLIIRPYRTIGIDRTRGRGWLTRIRWSGCVGFPSPASWASCQWQWVIHYPFFFPFLLNVQTRPLLWPAPPPPVPPHPPASLLHRELKGL